MRRRYSADEAVRAVGILQEVLGVAARISAAVLRQENTVRMICPARTSSPDVIGAEARRKVSANHCAAKVFDEPAHRVKCVASAHQPPDVTRMTDRSAADPCVVGSIDCAETYGLAA